MTRWGWRVLLAVVMLWMQQASLRHDLEHALEDPHQAAHVLCQECLSHHGTQAALASTPPALQLSSARHALVSVAAPSLRSVPVERGYWSRAPPSRSV
ncbi:MAG: hypothetical protein QG554_1898 [Pseudomonadota bacterium]|nr:hypothetical protein [Pseudomonadota bacterium]